LNVLIAITPSHNRYQVQAEKDTIALLLTAGHSAISSNLSFLNLLDFYNFLDEDKLTTAISELFSTVDCIFVMNEKDQHGFINEVIRKIKEKGNKPQIVTNLLAISNNEGYRTIKSLVQSGEFEMIAPNGQYLRKAFSND
jgi:hypothetical protein